MDKTMLQTRIRIKTSKLSRQCFEYRKDLTEETMPREELIDSLLLKFRRHCLGVTDLA
jgi:hypothetical protein